MGTTTAADPIAPRTTATTTEPTGPAPFAHNAAPVMTAAAIPASPAPSRRCVASRSRAPLPSARAAVPANRARSNQMPATSRTRARPSRAGRPGRRLRAGGRRWRLDTEPPRRAVAGRRADDDGRPADPDPDRDRDGGRVAV